jgi:peptide/nickel transport system permease protein
MLRVIALKLAYAVPVMFVVSLATFFILEAVPGDPAVVVAGPTATPEELAEVRTELGLDEPVVERYFDWLGGALTGDFGTQLVEPHLPVSTVIKAALPVTLELAILALLMALIAAIPAALIAAGRPNAPPDRALSSAAFAIIAIPSFLMALLLIFLLVFHHSLAQSLLAVLAVLGAIYAADRIRRTVGTYPAEARSGYVLRRGALLLGTLALGLVLIWLLPDFPRQGFVRITSDEGIAENLRSAFLPALTLAAIEAAVLMRLLRGDLITTLQEDFILAARAKGMPRWRILALDALRPSSFSLITVLGVSLGRLIGGTVIVEQIFNLPGMGTLMVRSIQTKDVPVVQAAVVLIALMYVLVNAAVDIAYGYLDPRVRRGRH